MRIVFVLIIGLLLACQTEVKEDTSDKELIKEEVVFYYDNGIKQLEGEQINGKMHGKWRYYYKNGILWSEGTYRHGERQGASTVYYETGKKKMQGNYQNGKRVGDWKVWGPNGKLLKTFDLDQMIAEEDSLQNELR